MEGSAGWVGSSLNPRPSSSSADEDFRGGGAVGFVGWGGVSVA